MDYLQNYNMYELEAHYAAHALGICYAENGDMEKSLFWLNKALIDRATSTQRAKLIMNEIKSIL
jgi:hypothetical protein